MSGFQFSRFPVFQFFSTPPRCALRKPALPRPDAPDTNPGSESATLCPFLSHSRLGHAVALVRPPRPPRGDPGTCSVEFQSLQGHNSLSTFGNACINEQIPSRNARKSSGLFQSGRPNRRTTRKGLRILKLSEQKTKGFCYC